MHFEIMSLGDAAEVLAQDSQGTKHQDGTTRYAMPCGATMVEVVAGQTFFKVTQRPQAQRSAQGLLPLLCFPNPVTSY